jgi:hypothetical protein
MARKQTPEGKKFCAKKDKSDTVLQPACNNFPVMKVEKPPKKSGLTALADLISLKKVGIIFCFGWGST